jgi:hypothetical protein
MQILVQFNGHCVTFQKGGRFLTDVRYRFNNIDMTVVTMCSKYIKFGSENIARSGYIGYSCTLHSIHIGLRSKKCTSSFIELKTLSHLMF